MNAHILLGLLEAHPEVEITRAIIRPGATDADLQKAAESIGTSLAPEVEVFYRNHNGVVLQWVCTGSPHYEEGLHVRDDSEVPHILNLFREEGPPLDGQLVVFPLSEVFATGFSIEDDFTEFGADEGFLQYLAEVPEGSAEGPYTFGEQTYASETEFRERLRYFDFFQPDLGVVLRLEQGVADPPVYYEPYRGGGLDPRRQMPLSRYLNLIVQYFGLSWRRDQFFDYKAKVAENLDYKARLEDVLARCREL
jgi:hypothetical protein